jgi:hypothetical protein
MDFIKRKVFLTKNLRPFDTNGDGVFNALVLSATTKSIQIPLTHSYDDMGIFEVSNEEDFEIIDIGAIFDGSIKDITQPSGTPSVTGVTWGDGDIDPTGNGGTNDTEIRYCSDLSAINGAVVTAISGGAEIEYNNQSVATQYLNPTPTFIADGSMCQYESTGAGPSGTGSNDGGSFGSVQRCLVSSDGHGDPGHVSTTTAPLLTSNGYTSVNCNASWFNVNPWYVRPDWNDYKSTALAKAEAHCISQGFTRVMNQYDYYVEYGLQATGSPGGIQPWWGVKYEAKVQGKCTVSTTPAIKITGTYWKFCFHCHTP